MYHRTFSAGGRLLRLVLACGVVLSSACRDATAPIGSATVTLLHAETGVAFEHVRVFARYAIENTGELPIQVRFCDRGIEHQTPAGFNSAWSQSCSSDVVLYDLVAPGTSRIDSVDVLFRPQLTSDGQLASPWSQGPFAGVYRLRIGIADEARRELPLAQRVSRSFNLMEPEP